MHPEVERVAADLGRAAIEEVGSGDEDVGADVAPVEERIRTRRRNGSR